MKTIPYHRARIATIAETPYDLIGTTVGPQGHELVTPRSLMSGPRKVGKT